MSLLPISSSQHFSFSAKARLISNRPKIDEIVIKEIKESCLPWRNELQQKELEEFV